MTDRRDPDEAEADRRARRMPVSPLLAILLFVALGVVIYVVSAILA